MFSCPACGVDDASERSTCRCGQDLTLLRKLDGIGNSWFNLALESLAAGATGRAIEWLAASCAARPNDAAACRALAKAWAQIERWQEASNALDRAIAIDPSNPEGDRLRQALRDAMGSNSDQKQPGFCDKSAKPKRAKRVENKRQKSRNAAGDVSSELASRSSRE